MFTERNKTTQGPCLGKEKHSPDFVWFYDKEKVRKSECGESFSMDPSFYPFLLSLSLIDHLLPAYPSLFTSSIHSFISIHLSLHLNHPSTDYYLSAYHSVFTASIHLSILNPSVFYLFTLLHSSIHLYLLIILPHIISTCLYIHFYLIYPSIHP